MVTSYGAFPGSRMLQGCWVCLRPGAPERKAVHFFSVGWHFVGFNTVGGGTGREPII